MRKQFTFPTGKQFAFTIFDDCDNSTVANSRPFYMVLERLRMRTTKTAWPLSSTNIHPAWRGSSTLEEPQYREFAQELKVKGFEIASHGASMMSSMRDQTRRALDTFRETFGHYPRSHANHGANRDNVYWFTTRFRSRLLQTSYAVMTKRNKDWGQGHVPGSDYFWGDLCKEHIAYVRGFTFPEINLLSIHRNVLYRDPSTPFVNFWFSACHAPHVDAFNELISPGRQEALAENGGVCIVATHVAAGFVQNGEVTRKTRRLLELLAEKDGWFVPVSTLLDYLRTQGLGQVIPWLERRTIELKWLRYAIRRGVTR